MTRTREDQARRDRHPRALDVAGANILVRHRALVAFVTLCILSVAFAIGYAVHAGSRHSLRSGSVDKAGAPSVAAVSAKPHLVFRNMTLSGGAGHVALLSLDAPGGSRLITDLECDRVDIAAGSGLCLAKGSNLFNPYKALFFGPDLKPYRERNLAGIPSRARVSPDGQYGAATVFVAGDSYAREGFSTRTTIFVMSSGATLENLERFSVYRQGKRFQSVDFNFWGVTFAKQSGLFYATLGTRGHTYLVRGDISTRRLDVLRDGVECPSLSPDNTRIAFKLRTSNSPPYRWRPAVLNLDTLQAHPLAETRNVNDQIEWLDDRTVLYAVDTGRGAPSTWAIPADGIGRAWIYISEGDSPAVVRG